MARASGTALVADENGLYRAALALMLRRDAGFVEIREACAYSGLLSALARHPSVSLVAVQLGLPGMYQFEGLRRLLTPRPALQVVVIGPTRERAVVLGALSTGVHGYVPTDLPADQMAAAFQVVLGGRVYVPDLLCEPAQNKAPEHPPSPGGRRVLTERQREVLDLLASGLSNKEIGRVLHITESTVKVHVAAAFRQLGVRNRVSAVAVLRSARADPAAPEPTTPRPFHEEFRPSYGPITFEGAPKFVIRSSFSSARLEPAT